MKEKSAFKKQYEEIRDRRSSIENPTESTLLVHYQMRNALGVMAMANERLDDVLEKINLN